MEGLTVRQEGITPVTADVLQKRFLRYAQVTPKTEETYLKALKQLYRFFDMYGITEPSEEDMFKFKAWVQKHEENGEVVEHKPATVTMYVTATRLFFRWLDMEGIYRDIAKHLKGEKVEKCNKKDYLTASQIRNVLEGVDRTTVAGKRDYAILVTMITGGLRTIEIERANIEDLTVRANQTVLYIQGKGDNEKSKYIKIPEQTEKAIREYLITRGTVEAEEPLFTSVSNNSTGKRMSTRSISGMVKGYMVKAGYNNHRLTAHSLRHTAVTLALLQDIDLQEVSQFARHKSIETTQIYAHNLQMEQNRCGDAIAETIF